MLAQRIILFLFLLVGFYLLSSPLRVRANRRALVSHKRPDDPLGKLLYPIVRVVAKVINLTSYKRRKLLVDLERAEIPQTPEEFYASAIVYAVGMCILSALMFLAGVAVMAVCFLLASVLVYKQRINTLDDRLKKKDEAIRDALPHFVGVVADMYKHDRNIGKIFESYLNDIPNTPLKTDLSRTIARINSNGSVPDALAALDKAVGNQQLSKFLTALSEAYKGVDQSVTFELCVSQMDQMRHENIRRKTALRPKKMKTVSYAVAVAILILFLVPLVLQLFSINTLF